MNELFCALHEALSTQPKMQFTCAMNNPGREVNEK